MQQSQTEENMREVVKEAKRENTEKQTENEMSQKGKFVRSREKP